MRTVVIDAKVEILTNYWNKLSGQLQHKAVLLQDEDTVEMLNQIIRVPNHIREAMLKKFLQKCNELHAIAFFQWRLNCYTSIKYNEQDIKALIQNRIQHLYLNMNSLQKPKPETVQDGMIRLKFYIHYKMANKRTKSFHIINFEQIGMSDPFPMDYINNRFVPPDESGSETVYDPSRMQLRLISN